ncbi:MAG: hypothetical protein H6739_24965 [Alphaproteobacteria bacterium]|nr:hypothetical protein [Alphaproteobacteria bacterium]
MLLLSLCLSAHAQEPPPATPPGAMDRIAQALGDQARTFMAWLYGEGSEGATRSDPNDPFHHPYPLACSIGAPPALSWYAFPAPDSGCAGAVLRDRRRGQELEVACPTLVEGRYTVTPPALEPGYWSLVVRSESGAEARVPFLVGPVGPDDASPCDPRDNGPAPACPEDLSEEEATLCKALLLSQQSRFWEVEALLADAPEGSDAANLMDQLQARYGRQGMVYGGP